MSKVEIKLSTVIELLDSGKNREEIAAHFDLKMAQVNQMFKHPKLKGLRAKKVVEPAFVLEDDLTDEGTPVVEETHVPMYGEPGFNPSVTPVEGVNDEPISGSDSELVAEATSGEITNQNW